MIIVNYDEAMNYIKNTAKFGSNLGLSRTEKILELLGNPHKKLKCIHIAGTNGKGSTTVMITSILLEAGYNVGMYTSPYLQEFEERIQINGKNIDKSDLSSIITRVAEVVDEVVKLGFDHPTEFEIITCAMFLYFCEKKVDYAVVEVGLGGRLDSTNVIEPVISVIASISYDHMHILGNTLREIALEKAGIIKSGVPVVLYPQEDEVTEVIESVCHKSESALIKVPEDSVEFTGVSTDTFNDGKTVQCLKISAGSRKYSLQLSLLGKHQLLNSACVLYTIEELRKRGLSIKDEHIVEALRKVCWPGRLEVLRRNPLVVIDGAHNIDGITKLAESVDVYFKYDNIVLVLGILADKQVEDMIKVIVPKASRVITVTPHSERAELSKELALVVRKYNENVESFDDYEAAYNKALEYCDCNSLLLISGSLYMIGDMRTIINGHKYKE